MLDVFHSDNVFQTSQGAHILPIIELATAGKVREFIRNIFSDEENLSFTATCKYGCTTGNFFLDSICPECKTVVTSCFASTVQFRNWIEIPDFAPPVLNPGIYRVLAPALRKVKTSSRGKPVFLLDLIMDKEATLPDHLKGKIPQGMVAFHEHFDEIMDVLYTSHPLNRPDLAGFRDSLKMFLKKFKDRRFVRYMPIMDPSMHLLTKYGRMTLIDTSTPIIVDALTALSALIHSYNNTQRIAQVDKNLHRFYQLWLLYPASILDEKLLGKKGGIRKTIVAGRVHCSFRGVIIPIVEPRYADELLLPWSIGVVILNLEIINLLCTRYKKTRREAMDIQQQAEVEYDPVVDAIINILITECKEKGLPVLFGRNPSIHHGAIQLFFVTKVKTDIDDFCISIHPLVLAASNAKSLASSVVTLL